MLEHPYRDALLGVNNNTKEGATKNVDKVVAAPSPPPSVDPSAQRIGAHAFSFIPPAPLHRTCFTVPGDPMGKPRMTQQDRWKKRPVVLRYRQYCDLIRACAGKIPDDPFAIVVYAHIAMADSWSRRKKDAERGKLCRLRPDYDNIAKAVGDALFDEDSLLGGGTCWKFWCDAGSQRTDVMILSGYSSPANAISGNYTVT